MYPSRDVVANKPDIEGDIHTDVKVLLDIYS